MHELQNDLAKWAAEYEASHVFMGEHANATIAAIRGGAPWRLSRNPHECSLYIDIRTIPGQTVDSVKRELRGILRNFGERKGIPEPNLHIYVTDPPVLLDEELPLIQALGTAQKDVTGERPPSIIRRPGADAVHLTAYGVPCVSFGPGGRMHPDARTASSMHAFGEHVLLDDCVAASKVYLAMALDLCNRKPQ
jgi:acetylornithine deacetylase/succinyl-diaminopimelate desuccinylase-like protein